MLRRAVAVELEVAKELNRLLCSVESAYLNIVREVAVYAVVNNVTSATRLQGLFYSKYRSEYQGLHAHLIIQAIRQAVQITKSFTMRRRRAWWISLTLRLGASRLGLRRGLGVMGNLSAP